MMQSRLFSDVMVVVSQPWVGRCVEGAQRLAELGLAVTEILSDEGVVEGTIEASRVPALQRSEVVAQVRTVFTYVVHVEAEPLGVPVPVDVPIAAVGTRAATTAATTAATATASTGVQRGT